MGINQYKNASVFHSEEFNKVVEEVLNKEVNIVEGEDFFYITHLDKKLKFLKIKYCPDPRLECVYGGVLGNKKIIKRFKGFWHITTVPDADVKEYIRNGFYFKERFTSILDLNNKNLEELFKNLNKKTKRYVRRGKKIGIKIKISKNIDEHYDILKETYNRAGLKILPKEFYCQILNKLGKLFLAEYDEKIIASAILLKYKNNAYFWNGGSYRDFRSLAPNELVHWSLIRWAKENDFKQYDLLGLDEPSIKDFKKGLGGREVKFYTLFNKPLYHLKRFKEILGV